jgi:parallel beta-helix repeat protein
MHRPAIPFVRHALTVLPCCVMVLVAACRMSETTSDQLVIPEVVRADLYVAPTGSDSNPGTQEEPFRTVTRAAQVVTPGTTVHVAPGIYGGSFKTMVSGTAEARIIFESTEKWGAKIVPPLNSTSSTAWLNRGSYVDIIGFEVDGSQYQGGAKWVSGIYSGGSYDTVRHNHVHHIANDVPCESTGGTGIGVDSYYRGIKADVIGNSVHDIGPESCRYVHGIYVSTSAVVKNNIVYRVSGAGIHLWHDASNVLITGNTVSTSSVGIVVGGGDYYHSRGPNDHTQVFNNIVYDNKIGIMEHGDTGKNNSYRNNLVSQNGSGDWRLADGMSHSGTISAPPGFVNYSRSGDPDFRLTPKSPAVGKGLTSSADGSELDFEGKPRKGQVDIGALQQR